MFCAPRCCCRRHAAALPKLARIDFQNNKLDTAAALRAGQPAQPPPSAVALFAGNALAASDAEWEKVAALWPSAKRA